MHASCIQPMIFLENCWCFTFKIIIPYRSDFVCN